MGIKWRSYSCLWRKGSEAGREPKKLFEKGDTSARPTSFLLQHIATSLLQRKGNPLFVWILQIAAPSVFTFHLRMSNEWTNVGAVEPELAKKMLIIFHRIFQNIFCFFLTFLQVLGGGVLVKTWMLKKFLVLKLIFGKTVWVLVELFGFFQSQNCLGGSHQKYFGVQSFCFLFQFCWSNIFSRKLKIAHENVTSKMGITSVIYGLNILKR